VPLSLLTLNVYTGIQTKSVGLASSEYEATITDTECEGEASPNNSTGKDVLHTQNTTTTGHLFNPYQPFGAAKLCVYNKAAKKTYTVSYTNSTAAGSTKNVYIGEPSEAERSATKTAAEGVEKTTKTNRETTEANERTEWNNKFKEKPPKITLAEKEAKEKTQKTNRETAEANEKATKTARETKEAEELPGSKEDTIESGKTSC